MLIKNAKIFTITNGITTGDVLIEGNIIKKIGNCEAAIDDISDEQIINANGKILMPGFINTHCHAVMYFMKGMGKGVPVKDWLKKVIIPIEDNYILEDFYIGTKRSCIDMIRNGITCFEDSYYNEKQIIHAAKEMKMRCCPSWSMIGPLKSGYINIEKAKPFYKKVEKTELTRPCVSVHAPFTCSTETLKLGKTISDEKKCPLQIHVSENQKEVEIILEREKLRPIEYLEKINFLSEKTILTHTIHINDNEIEIISRRKSKIAHCPASNIYLNSGTIKLKDILDKKINVSLGTDAIASNEKLSIQHEMQTARKIQNWEIPAETLVKMATINGAITLGLEKEIGSIEEGKKADLIILNTQGSWEDILTAKVETVICNGEVLLKNNKLIKVDEEKIIKEFKKAKDALFKRADISNE